MAVGTGIGIDLDALNKALKQADDALLKLYATGEEVSGRLIKTLLNVGSRGIDPLVSKLREQKDVLETLSQIKMEGLGEGMKKVGSDIQNMLDATNKEIEAVTKLNEAFSPLIQARERSKIQANAIYNTDAALHDLKIIDDQIKAAEEAEKTKIREAERTHAARQKEYDEMGRLLNEEDRLRNELFNAQLERIRKENEARQKAIQDARNAEIKAHEDRQREYDEMGRKLQEYDKMNASSKASGQRYAAEYEERTRYYERWINEEFLKEQENNKKIAESKLAEEKRINQQISQDRIDQLGRESQQRQKIEQMIRDTQKRNHDAREKELNDLFREQERQLKAQAKADSETRKLKYKAYTTSYAGAIYTSDHANTLAKEIKAVKNLEAARAKLTRTDQDYYKKLNAINKRIAEHNRNIERATAATKEHNKALAAIGRGIASAFSVQAIRGYVNKMIQVRGEMELQQRSLQAILQNKDEANEIWQKTIDLAVRSPFRIKDLVTYTKQLAAYRVENDKIFDTTKMLADVSAGLGVDMNRLILAFGQVKAANFLRGTELRQFTEAGIPMLDELAKHFNKMNNTALTSADVFDMISKRMVLFEDVEAVFERMTQAGGTFYRMQEIQSETLHGQISNLKDSLDIMFNEIGKANDGSLKLGVKAVKSLVDNYEKIIPILKTSIALFAIYKTNALLAARSITTMKGAWDAFAVSWGNFSKTLTLNPWMLWLSAIVAVGAAIYKVWKQFDDVSKAYENMRNQQSEITSKFFKAKDINEQKKALKELVDYANKEYELGINVDLKEMPDSEVKTYMNDLRDKMLKANAFGETLQKELIEANLKTRWNLTGNDYWNFLVPFEQGMNKDIDQMGNSYDNLNRLMLNKLSPTIDELSNMWSDLDDAQKEALKSQLDALESLKAGIGEFGDEDEDIVKYFDRIRGNFELLLESDAIADKKLGRQIRKYQRRMAEAEKEFQTFIDGIDETVMGVKEEDRTIFLNAAINDAKTKKNWSEFEETQIRKWLEKKYEIELTPKIATDPDSLKAWQDSYNELFTGKTGFRQIRSVETSQTQVIEQLNAQYESTAELLERIQAAGEDSVLEGGAYEGENLEKLKKDLADIKAQLDWFGAQSKDDKKEGAAIKVLQKRINLLKEVNKKYLELEKTFDAATAKEKVMEAYSDTFKEAFEGTGVELDMYKIMTQVITDSKKVGEDMGSSLSEGVVAKLKELEESGTYIRTANDAAEEFTKGWEQAILKAKDVEGLGKGYTIGYGEYGTYKDTKKKIGKDDVMTQTEAAERFSRVVYPKYVEGLNKILDKHKELILTQEQYNALLDLTYQGGYGGWSKKLKAWVKGPAELLIDYAKNEEQALAHIQKIRESFAKAYGEAEAETRFGDAFVEKLKQAETIYEKMALLLSTMNLTINGEVKKGYAGMVRRTDARVELFSGSLDLAKQLETVLVRIAGMDFTTTEGMVDALGKLKEIAEKEGPEAKNVLNQAISGLEAEIGVRVKKDSDKKLNDEVQAMFDRYELTMDLNKLNLPKGLAEKLFNVKYLDLDGLRKAVQDKASEFIGTDQYEKYQDYLDKIDEMERKSIIERTKKYSEYLTRGMNERVKLKIEELRMLKKLEESNKFDDDQKSQIRKQIKADTQKQLDKESWKQFQETDWYTLMFSDLETLGTQTIKNLRDELSQLKDSLSHLDPSEVKEIVNQMDRLQEQLIKRNPFEAFATAKKNLKALGEAEDDVASQLKAHEDNQAYAQKMLDMLAEIEVARSEASAHKLEGETLALFQRLRNEVFAGNKNAFKDARKEYEDMLDTAKQGEELTAEQLKLFSDYRQSLQGISDYWGAINDQIQNISGSAINIMDAYGVDEATKSIAEGVGSMSTLITQAIQFGIQMELVGYKSNMALGVIGWIAMGIQAIATVITAIANYKNAKIDDQLEQQAKKIERQRDLYEQLEEKVDSAYDVAQLRQYNNEMKRNIDLEIQALQASIALERSRKKADEDQIADWQKEIEEARERLAESTQDMMEELGGVFDLTDFTSSFVDAWWDAMDEGKSGLDALGQHFEDTMKDMVKKQALYQGANAIMKQVQDAINKSLEGDYSIDQGEWDTILAAAKKANVDLDAFLQGYRDLFGTISDGSGAGLSALQKGISGITESQAEILTAYWNSVRGYTASIDSKMDLILANMGVGAENNPMLEQLISQTSWLSKIHGILDGLTTNSDNVAGRRIKVIM